MILREQPGRREKVEGIVGLKGLQYEKYIGIFKRRAGYVELNALLAHTTDNKLSS